MTLLLDTQVLLWWREGSRRLGRRAKAAIEEGAAAVLVSPISGWEIAIKTQTGRLKLAQPVAQWMPAALTSSGFGVVAVTMDHAVAVSTLPMHHADPFDRLLIVQAQLEDLTIVTSDSAFDAYDVSVVSALD